MVQLEIVPTNYQIVGKLDETEPTVFLQSKQHETDYDFSFEALRPGLFRTTFVSKEHRLPPHRAAPVPSRKLGNSKWTIDRAENVKTIHVDGVSAKVDWSDGPPLVSITLPNQEAPIYTDLPNRSYVADGPGIAHYTRYNNKTLHLGLGEKPAPMDLSNRHFVLSASTLR